MSQLCVLTKGRSTCSSKCSLRRHSVRGYCRSRRWRGRLPSSGLCHEKRCSQTPPASWLPWIRYSSLMLCWTWLVLSENISFLYKVSTGKRLLIRYSWSESGSATHYASVVSGFRYPWQCTPRSISYSLCLVDWSEVSEEFLPTDIKESKVSYWKL